MIFKRHKIELLENSKTYKKLAKNKDFPRSLVYFGTNWRQNIPTKSAQRTLVLCTTQTVQWQYPMWKHEWQSRAQVHMSVWQAPPTVRLVNREKGAEWKTKQWNFTSWSEIDWKNIRQSSENRLKKPKQHKIEAKRDILDKPSRFLHADFHCQMFTTTLKPNRRQHPHSPNFGVSHGSYLSASPFLCSSSRLPPPTTLYIISNPGFLEPPNNNNHLNSLEHTDLFCSRNQHDKPALEMLPVVKRRASSVTFEEENKNNTKENRTLQQDG